MIIPVCCFTCNNMIASKYARYLEIINSGPEQKDNMLDSTINVGELEKTNEQKAFEELNIKRYCCKRHLLCHVDLLDKI